MEYEEWADRDPPHPTWHTHTVEDIVWFTLAAWKVFAHHLYYDHGCWMPRSHATKVNHEAHHDESNFLSLAPDAPLPSVEPGTGDQHIIHGIR